MSSCAMRCVAPGVAAGVIAGADYGPFYPKYKTPFGGKPLQQRLGINIDGPPRPGRKPTEQGVQVVRPQHDLPLVLAAEAAGEGGSGAQDVDLARAVTGMPGEEAGHLVGLRRALSLV